MSGLYPSLEDMNVDRMAQAQLQLMPETVARPPPPTAALAPSAPPPYSTIDYHPATQPPMQNGSGSILYPSLNEYMGLAITTQMMQQEMRLVPTDQNVSVIDNGGSSRMIAPVTGNNSLVLARSEIKQGLREFLLCKDQSGFIGLRVKSVNKGLFVSFVHAGSPAALVGLRFGDQILQINDRTVAGWDTDKALKVLKEAPPQRISLVIRERPFERTVTLQKDSSGTVGFVFKDNRITAVVKDSSAARNGILTDHHLIEVNGQNVIGLKEEEIKDIFVASGPTVVVTILPSFLYEHIMTSIGSSLVRKFMDHSIPDV